MNGQLSADFDWYLAHQSDLVAKYNGRFVVIKGGKVLGSYSSPLEAVTATERTEELGTFLVQLVEPGSTAYTQSFLSNVALSV